MPGLLRRGAGDDDGPSQRVGSPTVPGPEAESRLGRKHVRAFHNPFAPFLLPQLPLPPSRSLPLLTTLATTQPGQGLDTMVEASPDPLYGITHYRMPGEDDQGQAGHAALYEHEVDSETEYNFGGGDDGDAEEEDLDVSGLHQPTLSSAAHLEPAATPIKLEWDWDAELVDREREIRHDGNDSSFQVDRRVLRDVVKEKLGVEVARIRFISSGTFHKAYLVILSTAETLIARVARRFMPRLKVESEVATMAYLRAYTKIPVPEVYAWDSNPFNRLGGEYILMSRARGIPLRKVYHSMPLPELQALLRNLAELLIPLYGHRFSHIGSLYSEEGKFKSQVTPPKGSIEEPSNGISTDEDDHGHIPTPKPAELTRVSSIDFAFGSSLPTPTRTPFSSATAIPTPRHEKTHFSGLALAHALSSRPTSAFVRSRNSIAVAPSPQTFHVGPIISWPFFGSNRGDLSHTSFPPEIDRGPWASNAAYLRACATREVLGVARENEGRSKPHRLHLDPDDVLPRGAKGRTKKGEYVWGYGFVRRARLAGYGDEEEESEDGVPEDEESEMPSDDREDSDEDSSPSSPTLSVNSDADEDTMYSDYRRYQRSTFLIAELSRREKRVRGEMERWRRCMASLEDVLKEVVEKVLANDSRHKEGVGGAVSVKKVEVFSLDCHDLSLDNVFVDQKDHSKISCIIDWESTTTRPLWACAHLPSFLLSSPFSSNLFRKAISALPADKFPHATEWLVYERAGAPLRYAHKCVEWDGWEEGLVDSILGPIEHEDDESSESPAAFPGALALLGVERKEAWEQEGWEEPLITQMRLSFSSLTDGPVPDASKLPHPLAGAPRRAGQLSPSLVHGLRRASHSSAGSELEMERMLNASGDICGGRGGELGRRLEAWLIESSPEVDTKALS